MANELVIPGGGPAAIFREKHIETERLGDGIEGIGFSVIGIKGKSFYVRHNGRKVALVKKDEDGYETAVQHLDFVILRKGAQKSHTYYKDQYKQGSSEEPDCVSTDGYAPDDGVKNKQADVCQLCPRYEWKALPNGRKGRECQDSLRLAILPMPKAMVAALGVAITEPVLFRIPAASLKEFATLGDLLGQKYGDAPFCSFVLRVKFKPDVEHPQFEYSIVRWLSDAEAADILEIRENPTAYRILGLTPDGRSLVRRANNNFAPGINKPQNDPLLVEAQKNAERQQQATPVMDQGDVGARLAAERAERIAAARGPAKAAPPWIEGEAEEIVLQPKPEQAAAPKPAPKQMEAVPDADDEMDALLAKMRPQPPGA